MSLRVQRLTGLQWLEHTYLLGPQIRMDGSEDGKKSRKSGDSGSETDLESVEG